MISVTGLKKSFGNNHVLRGVDVEIRKGEIVTVIGPSGAGKTTFLRSLNWLDVPDSGKIRIDNVTVDAEHVTRKDIRALRSKTAMVFQHYNLFNNKTALENVTESLILVKKLSRDKAEKKGREEQRDQHHGNNNDAGRQECTVNRRFGEQGKVGCEKKPHPDCQPGKSQKTESG